MKRYESLFESRNWNDAKVRDALLQFDIKEYTLEFMAPDSLMVITVPLKDKANAIKFAKNFDFSYTIFNKPEFKGVFIVE